MLRCGPSSWGKGLTIHASVWPLELGLGTHNPRFGVAPQVRVRDSQSMLRCGPSSWGKGLTIHASVWPPELGLGTHIHASVWPLKLGLGTHNPRFGVAPQVGVRDSQFALWCGPLSGG